MNTLMYLFVAVVIVATGLVMLVIWSHHAVRAKVGALALGAALMGAGYVGFTELMGQPKPAQLEWLRSASSQGKLLASEIREGEAIYIWVRFDDNAEPVAYKVPWSQETAKRLHEASREGHERGTDVRLRWGGKDESDSTEMIFYAEPQPSLPPKHVEVGARASP